MRVRHHFMRLSSVLALAMILVTCGNDEGRGILALSLTDNDTEAYQAVYVTIVDVQVHSMGESADSESGWMSLPDFEGPRTINLLELRDGLLTGLGSIELASGDYTQIRLLLGTEPDDSSNILCNEHPFANYVIDLDDSARELKVPSGEQTGIKVICSGMCVVSADETTELVLDFDAAESVVEKGNGEVSLKPTIKLLSTEDFTLLTGIITEEDGETGIAGAMVSAQIFDGTAGDVKDEVMVIGTTKTDADGNYRLLLRPDDYNIVFTAVGMEPVAFDLVALAGETVVQDASLDDSDEGTVSGLVTITGILEPTFAHSSFRSDAVHADEVVELAARSTLSGDTYEVILPVSPDPNYDVISSTCDKATLEASVEVAADATTTLDVTFP